MRIGFIGAGRMGSPMVARLARAGHDVHVLARSTERRSAIVEMGAGAADQISAVCTEAEALVVCVFDDEQVRRVCIDDGAVAAMPRAGTLILHTTGSPRTAEAVAEYAGRRDIAVVDAPVSGGPHDAMAGTLTLFVGGTDDAVASARPVLDSYGDPVLHVGALGTGQKVKLVNNALVAAQIGILHEAVTLAGQLDVGEPALLGALAHGSATSRVLDIVAAGGSVASFIDVAGEFVGKDVAVLRDIAAALGAQLGVLDHAIDTAISGRR